MSKILYIVPALAAVFIWFCAENIYITVSLGLLYAFYFAYWLPRRLRRFYRRERDFRQCYQFINGFVIAMSVKKTPNAALESLMGQLPDELRSEINNLNTIDTTAVLDHLKIRFPFPSYEMFLTIIDLYVNQGGSILEMTKLLLTTLREQENGYRHKMLIARRKLTNYVILWLMTAIVLLMARFGVSDLYKTMAQNPLFLAGIGSYFAFALYAVHAWVTRFAKVTYDG